MMTPPTSIRRLIIFSGAPGSGKSHTITHLIQEIKLHHFSIPILVSQDQLYDSLLKTSNNDTFNPLLWKSAKLLLSEKISVYITSNDIIIDDTNRYSSMRTHYWKTAMEAIKNQISLQLFHIYMDTPELICLKRNSTRNSKTIIPTEIIHQFFETFDYDPKAFHFTPGTKISTLYKWIYSASLPPPSKKIPQPPLINQKIILDSLSRNLVNGIMKIKCIPKNESNDDSRKEKDIFCKFKYENQHWCHLCQIKHKSQNNEWTVYIEDLDIEAKGEALKTIKSLFPLTKHPKNLSKLVHNLTKEYIPFTLHCGHTNPSHPQISVNRLFFTILTDLAHYLPTHTTE